MKKLIYIGFLSLVLVGVTINISSAQRQSNIILEFNKTKLFLSKTWAVVQKFENTKATLLMKQAKRELDIAENLIFNEKRYKMARIHLAKARNFGNQAAKIVLNQPVHRLKKQLDDTINKTEMEITNIGSDEVRYLINQAKKFRKNAYEALDNGRINKAQEYYRIAFYFAEKAAKFNERNNDNLEIQLSEMQSNVEMMIIQVEELASDEARNKYKVYLIEAKNHYSDAIDLIEANRFNLALTKMRLIEKLLYRIIDQINRNTVNKEDNLESALYSQQAFISALEDDLNNNDNQRIKLFLEKAKTQLVEARNAYNVRDYKKANTKLNLSQRLANRAFQSVRQGKGDEKLDIKSQIRDNKRLLNLLQIEIEKTDQKKIIRMHSEARRLTDNAEMLYQSNKITSALQYLQLATRIMNKIQRQLNYKNDENTYNSNKIKNKIDHAYSLIRRLKLYDDLNEEAHNEIEQLEIISQQANSLYENQDYELADEYITFVIQQINRDLKKWSNKSE